MGYTLGSARAREGIGPEQAEPPCHATVGGLWVGSEKLVPTSAKGWMQFLHGGPVPGGGWPWRLGGHLGGWEESPCERDRA